LLRLSRWRMTMRGAATTVSAAVILSAALTACRDRPPSDPAARAGTAATMREAAREAALAAAQVWSAPGVPPGRVDFSRNTAGPGMLDPAADVECDFVLKPVGGTTPKFYCTLQDGTAVKVKYGATNPEVPAEVAASRLMAALGFPVDRMMLLHSVRCKGCPLFPFLALECLKKGAPAAACLQGTSPTDVRTFNEAMIERQFEGEKVEDTEGHGWAWFELDKIDPKKGGSSRMQVDALRLMAVLLAHWDNKAENQRLVCPPGQQRPDGSCRAPVAVLHDLGATFGPLKADLQNWKMAPMWADAQSCRVSMATLPYKGGTFPEHRISEEGRALAVKLLRTLSPSQLDTLFEASGVSRFPHVAAAARKPRSWTDVFVGKVDQIATAGPCPSAAELRARHE
jgi:hypothetical protein